MPTIRGNCLCCASIFDVTLDEAPKTVRLCNCSYCEQRVPHWVYVAPDKLKFERAGPANDYRGHKFCAKCGTLMIAMDEKAGLMVANARTFQDIEPWSLEEQENYNSRHKDHSLGLARDTVFEDPMDEAHTFYQGSCPCGAVRIALESTPLHHTKPINECNCSSCWRGAAIYFYPIMMKPRGKVAFENARNLSSFLGKPERTTGEGIKFCKTCGMWMAISIPDESSDRAMQKAEEAKEPEKQWVPINVAAVNVRALHDVPWAELDINKWDGRHEHSVREYVVD